MMACILARILAVTPQRYWKVGERRGWVLERIGEDGSEEYERRAGSAPEKRIPAVRESAGRRTRTRVSLLTNLMAWNSLLVSTSS